MMSEKSMKSMMRKEEKADLALRGLYASYGYRELKMGKFEEYDLYTRNRDFIPTESIIAFTGADGRLMTLRPDITLSVVRNCRTVPGVTDRISYSERIYRKEKDGDYREIMQTGLECLGSIDILQLREVTLLAAKSLRTISRDYVLDISHMGIIQELMSGVPEEVKPGVLKSISQKNAHELERLAAEGIIPKSASRALISLIRSYGSPRRVFDVLRTLSTGAVYDSYVEELEAVCSYLSENRLGKNLNVDFSIVNNMTYYSGILYKGYIKGIPEGVLSGGRYDGIMKHMGKSGGAVGFAVYLDRLECPEHITNEYDIDNVLIYDAKDASDGGLAGEADRIRAGGESLMTQQHLPKGIRYRKLLEYRNGEVRTIEIN